MASRSAGRPSDSVYPSRSEFHRSRESSSASSRSSASDSGSQSEAHRTFLTANSHRAKYRSSAKSAICIYSLENDDTTRDPRPRITLRVRVVVVPTRVNHDGRTIVVDEGIRSSERHSLREQLELQLSGRRGVDVRQITQMPTLSRHEAVMFARWIEMTAGGREGRV